MTMCPCGSEKSFAKCCEPYISGKKLAASAEILMRARYTAHTLVNLDFIVATHLPETREEIDHAATESWAKNCDWLGLEILNTEQGKKGDSSGTVEFIAQYREQGERKQHHELSEFEFKDDRWFFKDHHVPTVATPIRVENKIGRNDPCPCGSGKKSKKCCAKAA